MKEEWDIDFLAIQEHLDALDEPIPDGLTLRHFRPWETFLTLVENDALRFRRADKFCVKGILNEGTVHPRVQNAFLLPLDEKMLQSRFLAKLLYICSFTAADENPQMWSDFASEPKDVCLVTTGAAIGRCRPLSVTSMRVEYGMNWRGANPSDRIFNDKFEYEELCTVGGLEYETSGEFSFARPLKYVWERFRYQDEIRLVYCPVSKALDGYSTWILYEAADEQEFVFPSIPIHALIHEVVIRSNAPVGHEAVVRKLLSSIGCQATVSRSRAV